MEKQRIRPGGWTYALAALIPVLGCLIATVTAYRWFPGLPGTLESRIDLEHLTQVVVPGSEDITFAESGAYAVYYEHHSVVDGVSYAGDETPPDLVCSLTSRATGADVAVAPDYVETNAYATKDRERVGVLIGSITIDAPGAYTFFCRYADGRSEPQVVLAVGPNFMWEFLGIAARSGVTLAAGLVALLGSGLLAMAIAVVIAIKRHRSKLELNAA